MSRPRTQESPAKSKFALQSCDLRTRVAQSNSVAEISMKDFLDFLKISYQVNEAIDNPSQGLAEKCTVDWRKLTSDALVSRLKEREAVIARENPTKPGPEREKSEKNGSEAQSDPEAGAKVKGPEKTEEEPERRPSEETVVDDQLSPSRRTSSLSLDRKIVSDKLRRPTASLKKRHAFKKEGSAESETSRSLDGIEERTPARMLKKKLNEVLQEGIFDSVLPYLLPKQQQQPQESAQNGAKKPLSFEGKKSEKAEKSAFGSAAKEKFDLRRKSLCKNDLLGENYKKDTEVVIHVCDEIKNLKRDFKCSQKLLLSQMGYFAEVTTGQKLEDMDISVHCDVTIFDWLMRWVKKDTMSEEHWPVLDPSIAIPVLMSSAFLQMTALQEHCLNYCKNHINEIVRDSPNLSCINDNVLTRLANLFSNTEVENIVDKKDKIQSKLFCKLITALTEPEAQPRRGHYSSLATIYRCSKCLKLILRNMSKWIVCVASNMRMDRNGTMLSTHVYDSSWNLTDYVRDLKADLKTWRRVYWRLWAECHLLFCSSCEEYFPVHHMSWCRFHVEPVQYFPLENQRTMYYSVGRYPCCGQKSYRFEVVKKNFGCQYRNHVPKSLTAADGEVMRIWNCHKDVIREDPLPLLQTERIKFLKMSMSEGGTKKYPVKEEFWWEGMDLAPSKQPSGLLAKIWDTVVKKDDPKTAGSNSEGRSQKSPLRKPSQQSSLQELSSLSESSDESSTSSNAGNSEESCHSGAKAMQKYKNSGASGSAYPNNRLSYVRREKRKRKKKKKKAAGTKHEGSRVWLTKLSTRCNQDNQREFEERALRQIESVLARKLSGESFRATGSKSSYQVVPAGGIYVKLEQEWREAHCFSHGCPGSSIKARGSTSYVNVNSAATSSVQRRSKSRGHR